MHWDPTYSQTDAALSCNPGTPAQGPFGLYGDFRCDPPWLLIESAFDFMASHETSPDFVTWTGSVTLKGNYIEVVYTTLLRHLSADAFQASKDYSNTLYLIQRSRGRLFSEQQATYICLSSLISLASGAFPYLF